MTLPLSRRRAITWFDAADADIRQLMAIISPSAIEASLFSC